MQVIAVRQTGGRALILLNLSHYRTLIPSAVQGALEWLETNQDRSLEDITNPETDASIEPPALQAGETAKSMKCNQCGKKFRSMAQAQFHAEKTYVLVRYMLWL